MRGGYNLKPRDEVSVSVSLAVVEAQPKIKQQATSDVIPQAKVRAPLTGDKNYLPAS